MSTEPDFVYFDLGGEELGPPPDVGPSPYSSPSSGSPQDDDFDLGPPPEVAAPALAGFTSTSIISPRGSIGAPATPGPDSWDCVETTEVAWAEDPETGKLVKANEYAVVGELGSGSFGHVFEVERRVGEEPYRRFGKRLAMPAHTL